MPGETCQLVIIDRIPFPRPDDPLMSARQRAVDQAGGNGFMTVAATHAALLLAQGSGRLIRTTTDRGVVAVPRPAAGHGPLRHASCAPACRRCGRPTTRPSYARRWRGSPRDDGSARAARCEMRDHGEAPTRLSAMHAELVAPAGSLHRDGARARPDAEP